MSVRFRLRFLPALCFLAAVSSMLAQEAGGDNGFVTPLANVAAPYAGKYEARIGGSRESKNDKLRLDIGASVDLYRWELNGREKGDAGMIAFGADFFTWTRLRASGGFKFPVEAVDYYFGVNAAMHRDAGLVSDLRLRVAHISAHLVDGDPSFTDPAQQYITYSREFIDLLAGLGMFPAGARDPGVTLRPYLGVQWLFHTIPDTLGVITPYVGMDCAVQPDADLPIVLRFGYEARLNTELAPVGEHLVRLGVKFGEVHSRGVMVEGSYYAGRSFYGQHFGNREEYLALGFGVEF